MNILILSSYSKSYESIVEISAPNHKAYCLEHGYTYVNRLLPSDIMGGYPDLKYVRALLPLYDIIMRLDNDTLIMNKSITVESVFPDDKGQQIAEEGIGGSPYNAGVLIFRNERSSYELIDNILSRKSVWQSEQRNLCDFMEAKSHLVSRLNVVPARVMNSYCDQGFIASYKPGDFIVHFYCRGINYKLSGMMEYLK